MIDSFTVQHRGPVSQRRRSSIVDYDESWKPIRAQLASFDRSVVSAKYSLRWSMRRGRSPSTAIRNVSIIRRSPSDHEGPLRAKARQL
jgi:hypothetical protein